jgi:hypothetical protein
MRMTPSEFQKFYEKDLSETVQLAKQVGIEPTD